MILTGLLIGNYQTRLARILIFSGLILLFLATLPVTNVLVHQLLEMDPPLSQIDLEKTDAQAIVILGGGRYSGIEYHKETVSERALLRLRYGAWLQKQTGLPILVSGGSVKGLTTVTSEARLMAQTLKSSFGILPRWIEELSRNTWENAKFSRAILQNDSIDRILLVTHAGHMWRSKTVFSQHGFTVTPAPLSFKSKNRFEFLDFLPRAKSLATLKDATHEIIGQVWYKLYY